MRRRTWELDCNVSWLMTTDMGGIIKAFYSWVLTASSFCPYMAHAMMNTKVTPMGNSLIQHGWNLYLIERFDSHMPYTKHTRLLDIVVKIAPHRNIYIEPCKTWIIGSSCFSLKTNISTNIIWVRFQVK